VGSRWTNSNPGLVGRVVEGVPGAGDARKQTQEGETRVTEGLGTRLGELKMGGKATLLCR